MYEKTLKNMREMYGPAKQSIMRRSKGTEDPNNLLGRIYQNIYSRSAAAQKELGESEARVEGAFASIGGGRQRDGMQRGMDAIGEKVGDWINPDEPEGDVEAEIEFGGSLEMEGEGFGSGDSDDYNSRVEMVESGGNPNARTNRPGQTASGPYGFTEGTWLNTVDQMRRQGKAPWAKNQSRSAILDLRFDPDVAREVQAVHRANNQTALMRADVPITNATEYAAHFLGPGDAAKVYNADPSTPIEDVVQSRSIKANPGVFEGMETIGDLTNWFERKMG